MKNNMYAPSLLRLGLGVLFVAAGIMKLTNVGGVVDLLSGIGFPGATFWAWLLLLVEIVFGLLVLVGWKVKWTTIPLIVVIVVAILTVSIKAGAMAALKDFVILTGLISLMLSGPGAFALSKH